MKNLNSTFRIFLFFTLVVFATKTKAQYTVYNSPTSDYYIRVDVNLNLTAYPWCAGTTLSGGTDGNGNYTGCAGNVFSNIRVDSAISTIYCPVGPNRMFPDFYFAQHVPGNCGNTCRGTGDAHNQGTTAIRPPSSVSVNTDANTGTGHAPNYSTISWVKGSDIPDTFLTYNIYRDGALIASVPATTLSYTDHTLLTTGFYGYSVTTHSTAFGPNNQESAQTYSSTYVNNDNLLSVTQGTLFGRAKLSWSNIAISAPNGIEVSANGNQLAIVNANARTYDDFNATPGIVYHYSIAPVDANNNAPYSFPADGYAAPNGVISGYVKTRQGSGVPGVAVTASATVTDNIYNYGTHPVSLTDTTDVTGFYSISNVFYNTSAVYTIKAKRDNDGFDPDSIVRTLNLQNNNIGVPDITDTTAFTISGHVTYEGTPGCPGIGDSLFVNGVNTGIVTDAQGAYSYAALTVGSYTLRMKYLDHTFDYPSRTIQVSRSISGVDFQDTKKDTVIISLTDGCGKRLCDSATFEVKYFNSSLTCFDQKYGYDGITPDTLRLPAMKYTISIPNAYNHIRRPLYLPTTDRPNGGALDQITVDMTKRDTVAATVIDTNIYRVGRDTIIVFPNGHRDTLYAHDSTVIQTITYARVPVHNAKFVLHGPMQIQIENPLATSSCNDIILHAQDRVDVQLLFVETNTYPYITTLTDQCLVDSGSVEIGDFVSASPGVSDYTFYNGRLEYPMIVGDPNVPDLSPPANNPRYHKLFSVSASTPGVVPATLEEWMLVLGTKELSATYVSKAPPIPWIVLHDPPGSGSYTSLEKDSSVSYNVYHNLNHTNEGGANIQIQAGKGFYAHAATNFQFGASVDSNNQTNMVITATQTISTSSDPAYVGFDGDVFVGGTINTSYAYVYNLKAVPGSCTPKMDTVLTWGIDSVSSTFIYSAYEIRNTVIPNLVNLMAAAPDSTHNVDSLPNKHYFQVQISAWDSILIKDSAAIVKAFKRSNPNISFSAGASYDYTVAGDTSYDATYNYAAIGDGSAELGGGFASGDETDIHAFASTTWELSSQDGRSSNRDRTTSYTYHLEDDIPGNYYSVSIGHDNTFNGGPVFNVFGGRSACPYEPGTQPRDAPTLTMSPTEQDNVPAGSLASFVALLGNATPSQETRTYQVSIDPETNLDGATVKIGGQDITQNPANFTIPYSNTLPASLTVATGPFASNYHITVNFCSSCDDICVSVPVTAKFVSPCSDVNLLSPLDGWLINSSNHDSMLVTFNDFNASNPYLQNIGLQYRRANSQDPWANGPMVDTSVIRRAGSMLTVKWDVSNRTLIPDGQYQIRAYASCGYLTGGFSVSPTLNGIIDRTGFTLFGTPTPSSGVLNLGGTIGVQFNESVDCNQYYEPIQATLTRADSGINIPCTFTCFGNGLVLTTNPPSLIDSFNNMLLTARVDRVHDANGNVQSAPIIWSFVVNTSKVYWNPGTVNLSTAEGVSFDTTAFMSNAGVADSFVITKIPSWISIQQAGPYHLSTGIPVPSTFGIRFTVSGALNQGHYSDTVIAIADGKRTFLFVNLDVLTPAPTWSVDPHAYQYSMSIVANYSTDSVLNVPISSDPRDMIAVFSGKQCRGVGHITSYDPYSNKFSANITAYSNTTSGETFTFRMWNAMQGIEYQAIERQVFNADAVVGQPSSPLILHPAGEFQTIPFARGWNWFSLNVKAPDMSANAVLGSITSNAGAIVKTFDSYNQYYLGDTISSGWQGTLAAFNTNSSYMIYLDHADTLKFLGKFVTDSAFTTIYPGWNWIGFPRRKIAPVSTYLAHANMAAGDILKSESQFSIFGSGTWGGNLNSMYPGQGYKLKTANGFNFVVPPLRSLPSWNTDANAHQQNQTVTADLQFNGYSTTQSHYIVGAFTPDGTCVGIGQPQFLNTLNIYRVFMTLHGDSLNLNQAISFKVWDTDNDVELIPSYAPISMVPDSVVGRLESAYVINVQTSTGVNALTYTDGFSLLQNVPNPFAKTTSIQYTIPSAQQVTMTLYDESGRLIRELVNSTQAAGKHSVSFEQDNLQSGVYFYQMKAGDFVKTRRMMILQQ